MENLSCFFEAEAQLHGIVTKLIQRPCGGAARADRINLVIESWEAEALMKERVQERSKATLPCVYLEERESYNAYYWDFMNLH